LAGFLFAAWYYVDKRVFGNLNPILHIPKKETKPKKQGIKKSPAKKKKAAAKDAPILFEDLPRRKQIELEAEAEVLGAKSGRLLWANRQNAKKGGKPKGAVNKTTLLKRKMNAMLVHEVHERWGELMKTKFDLATGAAIHAVIIDEKTGKPKIDETTGLPMVQMVKVNSPDPKSSEYLMDHVLGKSTIKISQEEDDQLDEELSPEEQAQVDELFASMEEDYAEPKNT